MRLVLLAIIGLAMALPLAADQPSIDPNQSYVLTSTSQPGCAVTEVDGLCIVSLPGATAPLRLKIVPGLADPKGVSLESVKDDGYFLRHQYSRLKLHPFPENDGLYAADATFYIIHNNDGTISFRSYNFPKDYIYVTEAKELFICADPKQDVRSFKLGN